MTTLYALRPILRALVPMKEVKEVLIYIDLVVYRYKKCAQHGK